MRIIKLVKILTLGVAFLPLGGCLEESFEYDDFESSLHGQILKLNTEMVYFFDTEENPIGAYAHKYEYELFPKKWAEDFEGEVIKINSEMEFTILKSYWVRRGWLGKQMAAKETESHNLVLEDQNGIISICSFDNLETGRIYIVKE